MKTKKSLQEWQTDLDKYSDTAELIFHFNHGTEICFKDGSKMMYRIDVNRYFVQKDRGLSNQAKDLKVFLDSILDVKIRVDFVNILMMIIEKKTKRGYYER